MKQHPAEFDLTYRPGYWRPSDPVSQIIANVKGEARRQMILDALERRHQLTPPDSVESAFYRQLEAYYRWRNDQWLARELAAIAARGGAHGTPGEEASPQPGVEVAR
jgi:hypothetical protein